MKLKPVKGKKFFARIADSGGYTSYESEDIEYPAKKGNTVGASSRIVELTVTKVWVIENPLTEVEI